MGLTTTLAELADAIQRTADVKSFTDRHPLTQIYSLANRGLAALYRVMAIVAPESRPLASTTITTDGAATEYGLPVNCRFVISVEYTADGKRSWLVPFEMHERADLASPDAQAQAMRARAYRVMGDNIELLPRPPAGHQAFVWYGTTAPQLAAPENAVNVLDRLDDYVIWWAVRELATDRGDWVRRQAMTDQLAEMRGDIEIVARQRDLSVPARPTDLCKADRYGRRR